MTYRPEIDGLRAVAVLAVLLFHATGLLPGGFAGVDVFFVISGYVITSMLAAELDAGRFSLVRFYERRVRRLFPALAVTILVTAAASAMILLPLDLKAMGKSAVAAALMVSNVLFWDEAGYFDAAAQTKPLLHTWSLAIEEQFYLVYPLLLAALWKLGRRRLLWTLALLFGLSLAAAAWTAPDQPLTAFYLAPFRLWELMLGGLIALRPVRRLEGDVFAGLGVAMIATSFFIFNAESDFPGWPALLPTVGTALVLNGARAGMVVARALAVRPAVFVGKISYSLYLVHWPLIVLLEYRHDARLGLMGGLAVIGVSLVLAWLSWRFVEQPFRQHAPGRPLRVFSRAAAATALCCAAGASFSATGGLPQRLPEDVRAIYARMGDDWPESPACFIDTKGRTGPSLDDIRAGRVCSRGRAPAGRPDFIVWGDSHAASMSPPIFAAGDRLGPRGVIVGAGACPPLLDFETITAREATRRRCQEVNEATLDLIATQKIPVAFLVARWPRAALGNGYGDEGLFFDPKDIAPPVPGEDAKFAAALDRTLGRLVELGVRPVIVMSVPEPGYNVPYELARLMLSGRKADIAPAREAVEEREARAREIIAAAVAKHGADIVDPIPALCDDEKCPVVRNGAPIYRDTDHIARAAALRLTPLFESAFRRAATAGAVALTDRP